MYNIFKFFTTETLKETSTWPYNPSSDLAWNPVEACVRTQFHQDFRAATDNRDIAKLAQFLVKETMDYREPEDYAQTYNDYKAFLAVWKANWNEPGWLQEAMGLTEKPTTPEPVKPFPYDGVRNLTQTMANVGLIIANRSVRESTGREVLKMLTEDLLTLLA